MLAIWNINTSLKFVLSGPKEKKTGQAGAELGQAQVKLDNLVEVVIEVVFKAVVKVEV